MRRQESPGEQKRRRGRRLRGSCTLNISRKLCDLIGIINFAFLPLISFFGMRYLYVSILQSSREQLAIAEFARSLLIIPKTLAVNAAQDATDLVAKLRAYHNSSITKSDLVDLKWQVSTGFFFF